MTHDEIYEAVKSLVETKASSIVVHALKSNSELFEAIQPYFGNSPAQKIRTILHGNEYDCPNGKIRKFITLPTGYVNCGRAGKCKCASDSVSNKIKEREANLSSAQKKSRAKKAKSTIQSKKDGTHIEDTDKSPEHIDAEVVKQFVLDNMKHYSMMINIRPRMLQWVLDNTLIKSDNLAEMVYSAVFQKTNQCENGRTKQFSSWNDGFIGCGIARDCKCTSTNIGTNGSIALKNRTPEQKAISNAKREETMITTYGHAFNAQRESVKESLRVSRLDPKISAFLNDVDWLRGEYEEKQRSSVDIALELGIDYSTVISYCNKHDITVRSRSSYSIHELQIIDFIKSLGVEVIHGDRSILKNKEIDVYVPEYNFGIELNGLYWHSYNPNNTPNDDVYNKYKVKHLAKTLECINAGVELMHITDLEWINQKDIIKSMIRSKLGMNDRIHARKCKIRQMTTAESKDFFNRNHLQGHINSKYYIGLEYNDQIVMAISAGISRFDKSAAVELHRLAAIHDTNVIGGGSKLLAELKRITNNSTVISYCDRSKSIGQGYTSMGFKFERVTKPGYFWTDGKEIIIQRYKTTHANLKKWLPNYDPTLTEFDNMYNAKFRCYWDCGNLVFTL